MNLKLVAPAAILAAGLLLSVKTSPAKPDYTRRTGKDCEFCHPPDSRKLNAAGEYYRDHNYSLKGYRPPEQVREKAAEKSTPSAAKSNKATIIVGNREPLLLCAAWNDACRATERARKLY